MSAIGRNVVTFFHGNGFPPEVYTFLTGLSNSYRVESMRFRPLWSAAQQRERGVDMAAMRDWSPFVADARDFIGDVGGGGPVVGVGHSLGAVVHLRTAAAWPQLYRGLVLIEPVLLPRRHLAVWSLLRVAGLARHVHPLVRAALRRRRAFNSVDEAFERYRQNALFNRLSDEALAAYVRGLFLPGKDGGVELCYPPEWEAKIYETLDGPGVWNDVRRLNVPVLVLRGADSDTFGDEAADTLQRLLPAAQLVAVPDAGHLLPMERPDVVAQLVRGFIDGLDRNTAAKL